jgi:hypothetical protein
MYVPIGATTHQPKQNKTKPLHITTGGGGLYFATPKETVALLASNFSNNVAYGYAADANSPLLVQGGAAYFQDATARVTGATFLQNTAWVAGAHPTLSETGGGGVALLTQTATTPTDLALAQSSFLLNTAGGVAKNYGGALYKDVLSTLNDQGGVRVVPMEKELAGTDAEAHKSFNDVVLATPVRTCRYDAMLCES